LQRRTSVRHRCYDTDRLGGSIKISVRIAFDLNVFREKEIVVISSQRGISVRSD
jgi:hypothetical protein